MDTYLSILQLVLGMIGIVYMLNKVIREEKNYRRRRKEEALKSSQPPTSVDSGTHP